MIVEFIDQMRARGYAVESVIRVLREQGVEIAARTYRSWRRGRVSSRTVTDAMVVDAVRDTAWSMVTLADGTTKRKMTPEGLYGRRKMTAHIRRTRLASASWGAVDRAMRLLGLEGIRRSKGVRTTIPSTDGVRAGDLLNRDFTAPRPDHTWVMDFTYVRSWAGWVYVAFIVDVYSQRIVAWHAQTTKHVDLVMIPLRMALWERARQGHPVEPSQLRAHSDAGSQYTAVAYTEKLALDGIAPSIGSIGDSITRSWKRSTGSTRPSACAPRSSTRARTRRSLTLNTRQPGGWIGTTIAGSTVASEWSPRTSSRLTTTQRSTESCSPHNSGTKPTAIQLGSCSQWDIKGPIKLKLVSVSTKRRVGSSEPFRSSSRVDWKESKSVGFSRWNWASERCDKRSAIIVGDSTNGDGVNP